MILATVYVYSLSYKTVLVCCCVSDNKPEYPVPVWCLPSPPHPGHQRLYHHHVSLLKLYTAYSYYIGYSLKVLRINVPLVRKITLIENKLTFFLLIHILYYQFLKNLAELNHFNLICFI